MEVVVAEILLIRELEEAIVIVKLLQVIIVVVVIAVAGIIPFVSLSLLLFFRVFTVIAFEIKVFFLLK